MNSKVNLPLALTVAELTWSDQVRHLEICQTCLHQEFPNFMTTVFPVLLQQTLISLHGTEELYLVHKLLHQLGMYY